MLIFIFLSIYTLQNILLNINFVIKCSNFAQLDDYSDVKLIKKLSFIKQRTN